MSFGDTIKTARIARGWTQPDLGDRIGLTASRISRWETGAEDPPHDPEIINTLVRELGLSADRVLREIGYRLYPPPAADLPTELLERLLDMGDEERQALLPIVRAMSRRSPR